MRPLQLCCLERDVLLLWRSLHWFHWFIWWRRGFELFYNVFLLWRLIQTEGSVNLSWWEFAKGFLSDWANELEQRITLFCILVNSATINKFSIDISAIYSKNITEAFSCKFIIKANYFYPSSKEKSCWPFLLLGAREEEIKELNGKEG